MSYPKSEYAQVGRTATTGNLSGNTQELQDTLLNECLGRLEGFQGQLGELATRLVPIMEDDYPAPTPNVKPEIPWPRTLRARQLTEILTRIIMLREHLDNILSRVHP